ncbi:MAG TPA: type II toxin-antitoxin system VapC family toxin [Longimicrobiaceae bacterium]|nr:type II toxin-antitoxin system VapC family toxin [Longimicrobiaceae bacterium]
MVVDTSALIAYLKREAEASRVESALMGASRLSISAATLVEAGIVAESLRGALGNRELDALLKELDFAVVPLTAAHADLARSAYSRFGKGRHPASLNFGDCFAYALAQALGEPLLFVGEDFAQTDVKVAAY